MHERHRFAAAYVAGREVLDAACGTGWGWADLGQPRKITGIDLSVQALLEGRRLGFARRTAAAEMERLPFRSGSFDAVTCLEAIEHIPASAAAEFLTECRRVLRPGGVLVLSTPLRKSGRHSGNPWHCVEYSEEEIRSLLDPLFECVEAKVDTDGELPIFLYAGTLRQETGGAPCVRWSRPSIHDRAAAWMEGLRTRSGFRFTAGGAETVISTSMGVLLAEGVGVALPHREAVLRTLWSAQDPESGLFLEPLADRIPPEGPVHDRQYLDWTATYSATHALDALGERPKHPLIFVDSFRHREALIEWLAGLDWSNPWRESNRIMHLLSAFLFTLLWDGKQWAAERYHDTLDWLDEKQDRRTGLWGTGEGASLLNAVAGAYHFVPFYRYARRPVRGWSKIVDACLEIQNEDGLFATAAGGGACEDLDAVDLLCTSVRATGRLSPEVRKALTRAFWAIWNMQRGDGGFPYTDCRDDSSYLYSSWPAMKARMGGSDLWAGLARLTTLHTIQALLSGDVPEAGSWTFRRLPALGFHLADTGVPPDAAAEHRAIWFRPLPAPPQPSSPRVSVVIPCFNLGEYITETLASVKGQTLPGVETVIVDDGSRDAFTVARLDALAADGWRVIRTENRGLPAARNLGVRETRGEYVCCLDADDRLRPAYLEKAAAALEADARGGFVTCFLELFDEGDGVTRYPRPQLPRMLARNEAVVSSLFRREAWLEAGGYCESLPAMQDWDFWISILEKGWEGVLLPEVLFDYRIRPGAMSSQTRKPERYARISGMICARHSGLYGKYLQDVVRLKARFFADHVDYSLCRERAFRAELGQLRRRAATGRAGAAAQQPGMAGSCVGELPEQACLAGAVQQSGMAEFRVSWLKTAFWAASQAAQPREGWRGARNLILYGRMIASRAARLIWNSLFDAGYYAGRRQDVAAAAIAPSLHYVLAGAWEGADPSPQFRTAFYWRRHPDVAEAGLNPLLHYAVFGAREQRTVTAGPAHGKGPAFPASMRAEGGLAISPLVSVVIACTGDDRFLEEAIWSALRQTFGNLEVLVIAAGPAAAGGTGRVSRLKRAGLPRVHFIFQDQSGPSFSLTGTGAAHAMGRYVCFLDQEDLLGPSAIEAAVYLAEFEGVGYIRFSACDAERGGGQPGAATSHPGWGASSWARGVMFRRGDRESDGVRGGRASAQDGMDRGGRGARAAGSLRGVNIRGAVLRRSSSAGDSGAGADAAPAHRMSMMPDSAGMPLQPRPRTAEARAAWSCLEEGAAGGAVLMALPFFTVGGAERVLEAIARRWRERGTKVIAVTTVPLPATMADRLDSLRQVTPEVFSLAELFGRDEEAGAKFIYYLLRRHRAGMVFLAGCDLMYRLLPEVKKEFPRILVVDHLFNEEGHFHTNRAYAEHIDCTIAVSRLIERRLTAECGESPDRVAVVPQGIRLFRQAPGKRPPLPDGFAGKPLVGFFGRLSPEKAPVDFVRIAAEIHARAPEVRFVMTGEGPEESAVRGEIRSRSLGGVLHARGFVHDVQDWMAACDVIVVPSRLDGTPLVVLEAQDLGRCVVASRVGGIPEIVEDGVTGVLCEPGDTGGFAEAVIGLLESPETRRRLSEAGRERVRQEHSEAAMLNRYFSLFERLLAERGGGR